MKMSITIVNATNKTSPNSMLTSGQYSMKMIIIAIMIITIKLFVHLRTILHEDEHLLTMDLDAKVVDQVGMVDWLEDTQLIGDVPDDKNV